ncbi:MAG TPA: hypothetical protein VK348_14800 [Planctomycetota bacterium]|nr:hypothetical protein [Planctomycetota bacterium]
MPLHVEFSPTTVAPNEFSTILAFGPPGTIGVIGVDGSPGPTFVPGLGTIQLGLSPLLQILPCVVPPSGPFSFTWRVPCKEFLFNSYMQAVTLAADGSLCLSNATQMYIQHLGSTCTPPACVAASTIVSNFDGTPIPAGRSIWFNAVVSLNGLTPAGGLVGYRNAHIDFSAGGQAYSLPIPNALITVDPGLASAVTVYDQVVNQFDTAVPANYSGNIFLSGLSFPVTVDLPGGINPVTWTGEFVTNEPGVTCQWKWAAAVYTSFSTDYNALLIKPIDGSAQNPYLNADHAGTPEGFSIFVVAGARGGGGANATGSYSGTQNAGCN